VPLKAKFHYAIWFKAGSKLIRSWFEPDSVMKFDFEPAPNQLAKWNLTLRNYSLITLYLDQ